MTVTLSKPSSPQTNPEIVLKDAVERTCSDLVQIYQVDEVKQALLVDIIAYAILEKFREGQRDAALLSAYAIGQALKAVGQRFS